MKKIKRLFALCVSLVCVLCLSVSPLAYHEKNPSAIPALKKVDDHYRLDVIIPASTLSAHYQEQWKHLCSVLVSGSSSEFVVIVGDSSGSWGGGDFTFILVDSDYTFVDSSFDCYFKPVSGNWKAFTMYLNSDGSVHGFSATSLSASTSGINVGAGAYAGNGHTGYIIRGATKLSSVPDSAWVLSLSALEIEDDLDSFSSSEPEEPGESVPDTPPNPPWTPVIPEIPAGNEFVPYDTGIWDTFIEHCRKCMGSAFNIGILVFAFIFIWSVLRSFVNHYIKP